MVGHHHRASSLKQKNKKHKGGKHASKGQLNKLKGGKVEGVRNTVKHSGKALNGKLDRQNRMQQLRQQKRENLWLSRRAGEKDGPPKIVALIGLAETANLGAVRENLLKSATWTQEVSKEHRLGKLTHAFFAAQKQRFSIFETEMNMLSVLDIAKVADILVYVLPVQDGSEHAIDDFGDDILSAIRSQGVPSTIGVIQGLEALNPKMQTELRKFGQRFFETEFSSSVKIADANNEIQMVRALTTVQSKPIHWRDVRSYMLADKMDITASASDSSTGTLQVSGYLRGRPLSANQLVHIPDVGSFQLEKVCSAPEPFVDRQRRNAMECSAEEVLAVPDSNQEDLQYEADVSPFAAEQTWPTEEEMAEADAAREQSKEDIPEGMSEYHAAWLPRDEEGKIIVDQSMYSDEEQDQDIQMEFNDDQDDDDDMSMDDDDEVRRAKELQEYQERRKLESENAEFPDEVDIPAATSARVRFARFRGMKSFRTSPWDPKESLPADYARLFQFQDFASIQKQLLDEGKFAQADMLKQLKQAKSARTRSASCSSSMDIDGDQAGVAKAGVVTNSSGDYVSTGKYVTLHIRNVPMNLIVERDPNAPFVFGSLLKHENRMSVLNFNIQRQARYVDTIKSKDELIFHCGFRRYSGRPIFSDQSLKSDKHRFQRFLPQGGWSVASVYGPATFQPASVLIFRRSRGAEADLVAAGTLLNVNPDRIVLKRAVLTGVPVKVKRRKAVIRYMFHGPEDIRWFRPVELTTKHGLTGHIKESLGTHGDFKAVFNQPIKQHDTVCLNLYKRVYPKLC